MRQIGLLLSALLWAAVPAQAQVTVDLQALDALSGAKRTAKPSATHAKPAPRRTTAAIPKPPKPPAAEAPAATPSVATTEKPPATATPSGPPPATIEAAPPPTIALAPIAPPAPPAQPAAPPPPPPISDSSTTAATATGTGLRVTFAGGQADLSPVSAEAIKRIVQEAAGRDNTSFNVVAYAAGTPEDPSTARRLSLARALAVRSALMANGVNSSRIYVRALGATGGDEAPDRVDLAVMGGNTPAATPASSSAPGAAGTKSQSQ